MPYVFCDECGERRRWVKRRVPRLRDYRTLCCKATASLVPKEPTLPQKPPKLPKPPKPSILVAYLVGSGTPGVEWERRTGKVILMSPHKIKVGSRGAVLYLVPMATVRQGYRFFKCSGRCGMAEVDCRHLHRARIEESDWQKLLRL